MGENICNTDFVKIPALAGVAQWIEHGPANQKVAGLIPSQGTCLGWGPDPWLGACERQPIHVYLLNIDVLLSLVFSLPPPLSKNKEIKSLTINK